MSKGGRGRAWRRNAADRLVKLVAAADEVEAERMRRTLLAADSTSTFFTIDGMPAAQMLPPPPFSLWLYVRADDAAAAAEALGL